VVDARRAPDGFDARFSATAREYRYRIDLGPSPDPFTARYVWYRPGAPSLPAMRAAARSFLGERDFAAFCRRPPGGSATVRRLVSHGYVQSARIRQALLKVPREDFIPRQYRDYAYLEVPLPLPGMRATISCPHSYPLFYEPLGLDQGHRFLEVGTGSGYGSAVAREIVGAGGLVVSVEIDPVTFAFAKANLEAAAYRDIVLVHGDGGLGYPELSPYDRIAVTAAASP